MGGLLFEETSTVLVDPAVERLKSEFKGVELTLIPIHSVIRVDQVEKEGPARVQETEQGSTSTLTRQSPAPLLRKGTHRWWRRDLR